MNETRKASLAEDLANKSRWKIPHYEFLTISEIILNALQKFYILFHCWIERWLIVHLKVGGETNRERSISLLNKIQVFLNTNFPQQVGCTQVLNARGPREYMIFMPRTAHKYDSWPVWPKSCNA